MPEHEDRGPWRPEPQVGADTANHHQAPADPIPVGSPPRRRGISRTGVVAGGALGLVALGVAGWLAVSQGLIPGLGGDGSSSAAGSAPDLADSPDQLWTHTYLPRTGEVPMTDMRAAQERLLILTYPQHSDQQIEHALSAVDLRSGEELWETSLDVSRHRSSDYWGEVGLKGFIDGAAVVALSSFTYTSSDAEDIATVHLIDLADGTERQSAEIGGSVASFGDEAALVVIEGEVVSRLDPDDLTGERLWETRIVDALPSAYATVRDDHVEVPTQDGSVYLDVVTGQEPAWFDGADTATSYSLVGGEVFRVESGERGSYLEALDADGGVRWSEDADGFITLEAADGALMMFAAEKDRGESTSRYNYLRRLDPQTGKDLWDEELEATFDSVGSVVGDVFTLDSWRDSRSDLHDLDTGERVARLRESIHRTGDKTLYSLRDERLRAFDTEGQELWSVRARGASAIVHAPGYLVTEDSVAGRLTRWG
ncbi:PQQ-binding-like beta-propeller repeat protein [Ornithinimicrobium sp. Y1694]|uniref:outer membrane protein assembly factor BamB family protein n=1 Tax=Ornithinimicrobium sp. Y1694 TaxID=3418590 RepID=UPI003CF77BBF